MRDMFPGWTPPDEETLDRYWQQATVAVDASVLLDLYRFSSEARSNLLEVLHSFGERLWVPHQVAYEFHRNRFGVLLAQREAEDALLGELGEIRHDINEQLSKRLRGVGRRDVAPLRKAIEDGFSGLREKLQEVEKAHTEGLGDSIRDDPIYEEVVELCGHRIGRAFEGERLKEVLADAEERLKNEIPPGYMDAEKDGDGRFGDMILWHQLCDRARETNKPVILVADDQKADWVWEVRGKVLGPRPELVAEMREKADVGFHLYTPVRLLQVWQEREEGREVAEGVLDEIEEPATDVGTAGWERLPSRPEPVARGGFQPMIWPPAGMQGTAGHRFVEEGIELTLAMRVLAAQEYPLRFSVAVTGPNGVVSTFTFSPLFLQGAHHQLAVPYPGSFPGVDELQSGTYAIEWRATPEVPGELFSPDILVARHFLALSTPSSQDVSS
jgi:PIN domain-containing protein